MEKGIINNDVIVDYLEGTMDGKSRRLFERQAFHSGELNDLFTMQKTMYYGIQEQNDGILDNEISYSNEMRQIFDAAENLRKNKPDNESMSDYLQSYIQEQLSISRNESELRLKQLVGGVEIYYSSFEQQVSQSGESYISTIEAAMVDMPESNKIQYLTNVYLLLLAFNGKITKDNINSIKEQIDNNTKSEDVSALIDELKNRVDKELESATFPSDIINAETLRRLDEDFTVSNLLDTRKLDKEFAIYSAVCTYVAQAKGEIQITSELDSESSSPVYIGIGVASGIKQAEITNQYLSGDLEQSTFVKILKVAACVAAFALVAYLALHFVGPIIGELLTYLMVPGIGFWWNALNVVMLIMFFASLTLGVILHGAFLAAIINLIIDAVNEWVMSKRKTYYEVNGESELVDSRNSDKVIDEEQGNGRDVDLTPTNGPIVEL